FFQAEDGIRDFHVTGVQTCALPISGKVFLTTVISNLSSPVCLQYIYESFGSIICLMFSSISRIFPKLYSFCSENRFKVASILSRSEEHTSELQSRENLVCRLLLEKK